jgi:hypothetical protein
MNDIWLEVSGCSLHGESQSEVEVELVPRGANHDTPLPGHIQGTSDVDTGHVIARVIGANEDGMASLLEVSDLLQDAHVRPIIRKEGSWSYCQYAIGQ